MKHRPYEAFTLIELLIVISIIGLLAAVILVALTGAKTKATIASMREFDTTAFHSMGYNMALDWELDEGSGTALTDISGNNNAGLTNAAGFSSWTTSTPSGQGSAITCSGAGGPGAVTNGPIKNLSSSKFAVSAWVYLPSWNVSWERIVNDNWVGNGWLLYLFPNSSTLFGIAQSNAQFNVSGPALSLNAWHFLMGSYDGSTISLYIDGKQVATGSLANATITNTGGLDICDGMIGTIDEIRVYNVPVTSEREVEQMYAEGLTRHLSLRSN